MSDVRSDLQRQRICGGMLGSPFHHRSLPTIVDQELGQPFDLTKVSDEALNAEVERRRVLERQAFEKVHRLVRVRCPKCRGDGRINCRWDSQYGSESDPCRKCGCTGVVMDWVPITDPRVIEILELERLEIEDNALKSAGAL